MKEDEKVKEENILMDLDLKNVLEYDRFHNYLIATKKYKDVFWSKEAFFNFLLTLVIFSLLIVSAKLDKLEAINLISSLIPVFIGGLLTILALSLSGLAIVTATLGDDFLTIMIKNKKLLSVLEIIFSFYFAGFIIGLSIVILSISYIVLSFKTEFSWIAYGILSFLSIYFLFFSIIYSIMLLGTCLRLFFAKYVILKSK